MPENNTTPEITAQDTSSAPQLNTGQALASDINFYTKSNLQTSAGSILQQTLFWDYAKNAIPPALPKPYFSASYPNVMNVATENLSGTINKSILDKTYDDLATETINKLKLQNPYFNQQGPILNPGRLTERYDVERHNAIGYVRGMDNEALNAESLRWYDYPLIGITNTAIKAGSVAVSSIGYLAKMPVAILNGDINQAADNWLSNWSNKVYDERSNLIYHPSGYEDKNALQKLGTATWWADQGADMAGFVAGNLLAARAFSGFNVTPKLSQAIGNAIYSSKAAQAGSVLGTELGILPTIGNNLANNSRWLNSLSTFETALTSAASEATFEAADTRKRLYQDLLSKGYTPDRADSLAKENANIVAGLNMAVLIPSALWEVNALLKGSQNLKQAVKYIKEGDSLIKPGLRQYGKGMITGAGTGALVEGAWEENVQGSIQSLADKLSKGTVDPNIASAFNEIVTDTFINNWQTPEGQESIVGGMVMGILMGAASGRKDIKQNYNLAKELLSNYQNSYSNEQQLVEDTVKLADYIQDRQNYIKMSANGVEELDKNGRIQVNIEKLISDIKSLGLQVDISNTMAKAAEEGNDDLVDIGRNQLLGEYVYNHMSNGLEERMFNKLSTWQNMTEEDKQQFGILFQEKDKNGNVIPWATQINNLKRNAQEYKELWNHVDSFFSEPLVRDNKGNSYGFDTKAIFREGVLNKSLSGKLNSLSNELQQYQQNITESFDRELSYGSVSDRNERILWDTNRKIEYYISSNPTDIDVQQYNKVEKLIKDFTSALKNSNKRYKQITDRNSIYNDLSEIIQRKEETEKKVRESNKQLKEEAKKREKEEADRIRDLQSSTGSSTNTQVPETGVSTNTEFQTETGEVIESTGTNQTLEDLIANASNENVLTEDIKSLDPSMVTKDDGESVSRPSDAVPGNDKLEKARYAFDKILESYPEDVQGNIMEQLAGLSVDQILERYDNQFGSKKAGNIVTFQGRPLKIGDKYRDNADDKTIWKVKGINTISGDLLMYSEKDPNRTTRISSLEILDQMENLNKLEKKEKTKEPKPLDPGEGINKFSPNVFRIPNINTFVEIFQNKYSMSKGAVNDLLKKTTSDELANNIYIKFLRESDPSVLERSETVFFPTDNSRNLEQNPSIGQWGAPKYRFQFMYGDDIIGYGTDPNKYLFTENNTEILVPNMTEEFFSRIYELNQANPGTLGDFKNNYNQSLKIYNELITRLSNSNELTLSPQETQKLISLKLNPGEYDYSDDKQYKLSELEYSTIDGDVFIYDMQNVYDPATGNVIDRTENIITSNPARLDELENMVKQARAGKNGDVLRSYGRYVAAIKLPNESIRFVELSTALLDNTKKEKILNTLRARQGESFNNIDKVRSKAENQRIPLDATFNDDFNNDLDKTIFVTNNGKGISTVMSMSPTGILRLEIFDYSNPRDNSKGATIYINRDLTEVDNLDQLIPLFNKEIKKWNESKNNKYQIPIKVSNFRESIPSNISSDDALELQTNVNPGIVKNASLQIDVKNFKTTTPAKSLFDTASTDLSNTQSENIVTSTRQIAPAPELIVQEDKSRRNLDRLTEIDNIINDVKNQAKNKTLTESGVPFIDDKARNIYAQGIIKSLQAEKKRIINSLPKNPDAALKQIESQSSSEAKVGLDTFKSWLKNNLPSYIEVTDINNLISNLTTKGQTVGMFQTSLELINGVNQVTGGVIGTSENNPFKYHEAFHAVFRLLLNENQIKDLLDQASREVRVSDKMINDFRDSSSLYTELTDSQIKDRIYEEYLADKFDEWKTNKSVRTSSKIKNFFKKILDWFKAFSSRIGLSKQDMLGLFEDINSGRYKRSQIRNNRFTASEEVNLIEDEQNQFSLFPTQAALKLIKIGEEITEDEFGNIYRSPKYLSQSQSNRITGTIVSVFLQRYSNYQGNSASLINEIMNDFANLYNSSNDIYTQRDDYFDISDSLDELHNVYTDPEARGFLIENINYSLQQLGFKQSEEQDILDDNADDVGDRQVGNYTIETSAIGGFGSLSKELRRYIASTTYEVTDDFGNTELVDGEPLVEAVNSDIVYNGILKALANINDVNIFVNRLVEYADGNEESAKFIQRFVNDTGLVVNEDGSYQISKNPTLFQMVVKGFNQYRVDYLFTRKDANSKAVDITKANARDVAQQQFDQWYNSFTSLYQDRLDVLEESEANKFKADRKKVLDKIKNFLQYNSKLSNTDLDKQSRDLTVQLKAAYGISLSRNYMKYSIISGMKEENRTIKQKKYFSAFSDVTPLSPEDITEISKTLQRGDNPFVKNLEPRETVSEQGEEITTEVEVDTANIGRLKKIADNNAIFDETVGSSSFVNAEGKTVYGHQLPTFHLVQTTELNSKDHRKSLKKNPYLSSNYLLNSEEFTAIADTLRVQRIDGLRQVTFSQDPNGRLYENKSLDVNKREGIVYGSYTDREFLLNMFDLYLYQQPTTIYTQEGNKTFMTAPSLIRVLEASNTGDTVSLPVKRFWRNGNITEDAVNILYNEVENEYKRIQRAKKEIVDIQNGTKTTGIIEDYHNGKLRGLRFFKTANMLGDLRSELENKAQMEKNYKLTEDEQTKIKEQLKNYFREQNNALIQTMLDINVLQRDDKGKIKNILLPSDIEFGIREKGKYSQQASDRMNLSSSLEENIGQIFMNDFINTFSFNQLILGDVSKGLKDSVDEVKRAKGANGAGPSIEANIIAPELGINHTFTHSHVLTIREPKGQTSQGSVDKADAQMWLTVKGLRYTLFGLGKLNSRMAAFLDKIENGHTISKEDVFGENGSLSYDGQTNSIKLVYYDGEKYIKTSGVILQKTFTSYKSGDNWLPLPGREQVHRMRETLEDYETRNSTVAFMIPKSASKSVSEDIVENNLSDVNDTKFKQLSNKYWRLQLENPSNKITITDPTQAKQLIDMEQDDNIEVIFRGVKTSIGELRNIYQQASEQRVKNNYLNARNQIFTIEEAFKELDESINMNKVTPKLQDFQLRAIESLQANGSDSQLIGFFELDEQGNPKYNLNMPITLDKYTQLFLAYFSKGVTNEKVPGHAVALMSDFGVQILKQVTAVDENGIPTRWKVIRTDQFTKSPERYKDIKSINTDIFQVGDYYIDDLKHNVPEYNQQGEIIGYYSEFMLPAHFAELMDIKPGDEIPNELAKAFGVRIPSQDKHSFISLRLVDFMPANMGSTGIFPQELVKISGADFDIDKLYMSISSWYRKPDGRLVRYGDEAKTNEDKYDEFLDYSLKNNKELRKLVKRKLEESKDYNSLSNDLKLFNQVKKGTDIISTITEDYENNEISWDETITLKPDEIIDFIQGKLKGVKQAAIIESLKELNLPSNVKEFISMTKERGELNNGVLNNIILDAKIQFLTNDHIRPVIAETPASVDDLKDLTQDPDLKPSVVQETNLDTDSILGKYNAFKNNKEGAANIGPAVNAMLVYSLLNKFKVGLRSKKSKEGDEEIFKLVIDNKVFGSYGDTIAQDGHRIMHNISTEVSAMTDNAKERLAAKLNMILTAIGPISNMLAQGVPLKTAISIVLQPSVKEYFTATRRFSAKFKSREDSKISGESVQRSDIGKKILDNILKTIPESSFDVNYQITTEELLAHTRGEANNPMLQWKVLSDYMKVENQSRYFSAVAQIIKLAKGMGTSFEYGDDIQSNMNKLGLNLSDKEFEQSDIPFDVRNILTGKDKSKPYHRITANYINIFNQVNELSKSMFLEKTDTFNRIKDITFSNMDFSKDEYNISEESIKLKRNLISYLSFRSYQKLMMDENKSSRLNTLSNKLLYDKLNENDNFLNIVEIVKLARQAAPNNYLINRFLNVIPTSIIQKGEVKSNKNNRDQINKIESNTWSKISNMRSEMLQDSFRELYNNPDTKQYAIALFNYLIIKDGLQFKSGSFLKFIPNFMFYDVLRGTSKAVDIMKLDTSNNSQEDLDKKYKDTFNMTQTELFNDFIKIYLSNTNNAFHIPQITKLVNKNVPKTSIKYSNDLQNELVIDIFADVRNQELEGYETGKYGEAGMIVVTAPEKRGKLDEAEKDQLRQNLTDLKESGFAIESVEEIQKGKRVNRLKVNFPYVISIPGKNNQKRYFRLVKLDNRKGSETESRASQFINRGDTIAKGTKAQYQEFKLKGVKAQTPIAEMFGEIPDETQFLKKPTSIVGLSIRDYERVSTNPSMMESMTAQDLDSMFGVTPEMRESSQVEYREGDTPPINFEGMNLSGNPETNLFYQATPDYDMSGISDMIDEDDGVSKNMKDMDSNPFDCGGGIDFEE